MTCRNEEMKDVEAKTRRKKKIAFATRGKVVSTTTRGDREKPSKGKEEKWGHKMKTMHWS